MLNDEQIESFERDGFVVVEDVFDQQAVLDPVRAEYSELLDRLYDQWHREGKVDVAPEGLSFDDKLLIAYRNRCDWFQPFDISLPGDRITADTPMHFGPAIFNLLRSPEILDIVEQLIGPEITSNPIQHVRIKPPAKLLHNDESRPHLTITDWHQDQGVTLEEADSTEFVTVWLAITDATLENGCLQVSSGDYNALLPHCASKQVQIPDQFINALDR